MPYGAQGGEGVAERGGGGARREGRSFREQFAVGLPFSGRFHPGLDPEPEDLGAGCGDGGGGRSRGLPAYFPEAPRAEGEGRTVGGRGRGGWVWRCGSHRQPQAPGWPTGSEIESGSNRLFKLPRLCAGGGGARRAELGAISHASPPRLRVSQPTRLPPASRRGGAREGMEGALSAHLGRRGVERKLANEGQKGWGRRNYFFFNRSKDK